MSLLAGTRWDLGTRNIRVSENTSFDWLDSLIQIIVPPSHTYARHTASLVSALWNELFLKILGKYPVRTF